MAPGEGTRIIPGCPHVSWFLQALAEVPPALHQADIQETHVCNVTVGHFAVTRQFGSGTGVCSDGSTSLPTQQYVTPPPPSQDLVPTASCSDHLQLCPPRALFFPGGVVPSYQPQQQANSDIR